MGNGRQVSRETSGIKVETVERPWGSFQILYQSPNLWVKILTVNPGEAISLQYHEARTEHWVPLESGLRGTINGSQVDLARNVRYAVPVKVLHRISNPTDAAISVIEVATGAPDETDIVRVSDKYDR